MKKFVKNKTMKTEGRDYYFPKARQFTAEKGAKYSVGSLSRGQVSIHLLVKGFDEGPLMTFNKGDKESINALLYLVKQLVK